MSLWERLPAAMELATARRVYSAKAHSRGIDSILGGLALQRGDAQSPGGLPCIEANVVAPDALCLVNPPASGASRVRVGAASMRKHYVPVGAASSRDGVGYGKEGLFGKGA
jgi:hypothetical protein